MDDLHKMFDYLNRCLEKEGAPRLFGPDVTLHQTMYAMQFLLWTLVDNQRTHDEHDGIIAALRAVFGIKEAA